MLHVQRQASSSDCVRPASAFMSMRSKDNDSFAQSHIYVPDRARYYQWPCKALHPLAVLNAAMEFGCNPCTRLLSAELGSFWMLVDSSLQPALTDDVKSFNYNARATEVGKVSS